MKYNSNCTTGRRETDQLKVLYDNMKQKTRKNVGESNKNGYLYRKPLKITEEDVLRRLQNVKEDKVQLNKTCGGFYKHKTTDSDTKILAIRQDQVEPLPNPFDSGAIYFKDQHSMETYEPPNTCDESINLLAPRISHVKCEIQDVELTQSPVIEGEILNYYSSDTMTQGASEINTGANQHNQKQKKNIQKKSVKKNEKESKSGNKKLKRNMSAEALKRIYFKKKCENACLERKKLALEILYLKQIHNLKMTILKKQLDAQP